MARRSTAVVLSVALLNSVAQAGYPGWSGSGGGYGGSRPPWWDGDDGGNGDDGNGNNGSNNNGNINQGALFSSEAEFNKATRILIAHAVLASLVWVLFIPSLAILVRLNLKAPIILKLHAIGQVASYIIYIVATGTGIWLAQQSAAYGVWNDPHPRLGLAILAIAFFQPIFGAVHHRIYKSRSQNVAAGNPTNPPGRTPVGRAHLWLGRVLIALGIINGGLGIRLASYSPFQTDATSQKASIGYGVVAGVMFLLYLVSVIAFEIRRARLQLAEEEERERTMVPKAALPTYDESQECVGRPTRYQ
ncbi:hypothetical protein LTR84_010146 [Exophiala bonariae]|uniref:Cytochrome b561 domain-containing protein n=1 Tax=Exophiala bonariae TaxID=1690606 RepID=A0AAV9MWM0_9EURO|nr:hypothetical protein LTR84_010146 [Exophiala bonariae]